MTPHIAVACLASLTYSPLAYKALFDLLCWVDLCRKLVPTDLES